MAENDGGIIGPDCDVERIIKGGKIWAGMD